MSGQFDSYKEKLGGVDFEKARDEIAYMLKIGRDDAKNQGSDLYIKPEFHDALVPFMSNPCLQNAIKLLEVNPTLYVYFEQAKLNKQSQAINRNFEKGKDSAKLTSHKQALLRALIQGIIIAGAIFNPFNICIKIAMGLFGLFLYGIVASMERFKGKL